MAGGKGGGQGGRGAKPGSHRKGAPKGSGGQNRRALEGRGPTPPADERKGHPAARRAKRAAEPPAGRGRAGAGSATGRGSSGRSTGRTSTAGGRPSTARRPARAARPDNAGPEIVTGRNPVVEALRAGIPATALYVANGVDMDERVREAVKLANQLRIPLLDAERVELDRYAQGAVHQGLVLQVPLFDYAHPDELLDRAFSSGVPLIVALDGVTDPRNLGAVVRSVGAFGGHGVLIPERRAAGMTASAWKASAGAAARVPVARATNLTRALTAYADRGVMIVGLAGGGSLDITDLEVATDPLVLVVGSEGKGLSRLVQERCDLVVRIPISAATESLNASVAAGVALYEVARRRLIPT
ncbi:MAG: rRNA (guanosine2251-2-O)-methyltransferase [Actinomycetota bacterium]|nr:rRNA (guanosine2251-2-O)-methyltransferase [Actinomycetota bacterium]